MQKEDLTLFATRSVVGSHDEQPMPAELEENNFLPGKDNYTRFAFGLRKKGKICNVGHNNDKTPNTIPVNGLSEVGRSRTIATMWVCESVLRNVCRN